MSDARHRVLITGSKGLIGHWIAHFAGSIHDTVPSSRDEDAAHYLDLSELDSINSVLNKINPDTIINCAAITSIASAAADAGLSQTINTGSVELMAKWCSKNNVRLIHFSTDFVFEGNATFFDEESETHPLSLYGETKLQSEKKALMFNENTVVVRTSLVYGHHSGLSRLNFPLYLKEKLERGESLSITADQFRSPTYVEDLADAAVRLIGNDFTGLIHLAGPQRISVLEFAERVASTFHLNKSLLNPTITVELDDENKRPLSTGLSIELARNVLGYNPMNPKEGLLKMSERMLDN